MAKRFRFWSIVVGALFFVPVLLAACGPSTTGGSNNGPKQGGTITDGLYEEPDSLLPFLTNETYAVMVDQALWAPLWYGDPSGQLHAGIAKEVPSASNGDVSADLKTWTIKVQSGLKWSDGSPLTADDVAFSLKTYTDPAFGNTFGLPTTDPKDPIGVASVTEPDSSTVVLTLRNPDVAILSLLADGASSVIPKSVFGSLGAANVAKSPQAFKPTVTSGPFMMSERVQGDHITLVRNPNYYQAGKPYLDKLIFKIIANQDTILTALQSGTIDTSWFLDVTKFNAYKAISGYTTTTDANPAGYEVLVFNECTKVGVAGCVRTSLLQDKAIRQALTMSFDPNILITQLYNGAAKPTCDGSAGTVVHEPNLTCYQQDTTKAGQILDQDGWTMGTDGFRHKNGQKLELVYATTNKTSRKATQLLAQAAWKKIGISIVLKNYAAPVFFGTQATGILHSGNFDIGEFANTLGYDPDDHTFFMCNQTPDVGGSNYMRYCNSAVDAAEATQQGTADLAIRKTAFQTIHKNVLDDVAVMYLYTAANIAVHVNRLQNYNPSALGAAELWNIWDWYVTA